MWRVIVRISFFHDTGSRLRNFLAPIFNNMGLQNTITGTWESAGVDLSQAWIQMSNLFQVISNPQAIPGVDPQVALNHIWIYIDRA